MQIENKDMVPWPEDDPSRGLIMEQHCWRQSHPHPPPRQTHPPGCWKVSTAITLQKHTASAQTSRGDTVDF